MSSWSGAAKEFKMKNEKLKNIQKAKMLPAKVKSLRECFLVFFDRNIEFFYFVIPGELYHVNRIYDKWSFPIF